MTAGEFSVLLNNKKGSQLPMPLTFISDAVNL
jgi:hypothetical protein